MRNAKAVVCPVFPLSSTGTSDLGPWKTLSSLSRTSDRILFRKLEAAVVKDRQSGQPSGYQIVGHTTRGGGGK